jgi:hypothetical protein
MEPVKIVVRLIDGRVIKGYTNNFNPSLPSFHLDVDGDITSSKNKSMLMEMKEIKAVFFVRTFEGNKGYDERKNFNGDDCIQGRKAEVCFVDNEILCGSAMSYDPEQLGFFLIPIDPKSNNMHIFVVLSAVKSFRFL